MKVLIVGSGGREHALAWQLAQSDNCGTLYCAPGNAGIAECAHCVNIAADNVDALVSFAKDQSVDLVVVGPEAPLVAGLVDRLREEGIKAFGPTKAASRLEGSKTFMKDICAKYDIPTASYGCFTDLEHAKKFIAEHNMPIVVKADGLAGGKGVIICHSVEEAEKAATDMLQGKAFGNASTSIVIEEFLDGEEISFFALADGQIVLPLTSAQDHKQIGEGDTGLNTGGMGAYSPAHLMTDELEAKINTRIVQPLIEGMAKENCPYAGVLFAGLMIIENEPKLLEINVRFGDPECQALMMRLNCDLLEILNACAEGRLTDVADHIRWRDDIALCVVMAAQGYPGPYLKNTIIDNIREADGLPDTKIFHAGTGRGDDNQLISVGGRVLGVTSLGQTIEDAQRQAYQAVDCIEWPDGFYREDIGWRAVEAQKEQKKSVA